jgi:hypothetical protein
MTGAQNGNGPSAYANPADPATPTIRATRCPGLTNVLECMVSCRTKAHELEHLLLWAWKTERLAATVDA